MTALAYRLAEPEDMTLVVSTWVESYRTSRSAGLVSMARWADVMGREVADILARPGVAIHVAHHPGEEGRLADLYGWIAVERGYQVERSRERVRATEPLVLYVYVKQPYRRLGIARGLFKAAGVGERFNYACRTAVVTRLADKIPGARWEHMVVRFPKTEAQAQENDVSQPAGRVRRRRRREARVG